MAENFQDNVIYASSTLSVKGDAILVGSTDAGAKSVIFNNSGSQGHLAWQPTANRTINLPDSGGTIQLTGQVPGAIYDGANSISSGTIRFTNANNISFSINGQTISGSVAAQTVQTQSNIAGVYDGANSISTGTIRFTNANGVSFSINGQTISGSVAVQTNQTVGLYALGNTTQNSSTTLDARTLSFNGLGAATVGYSNGSIQISVPTQTAQTQSNIQAIYDGANSISTGTIRFTNANNISFSINGQTISGSVAAQTVQTVGLYAVSNTTQNSSTTLDARTISFQGAGIASVGYSNGSVIISVPSGGGAGDGVNIIAAGTQTAATTGTVIFSNSNGISFGMSNSSIVTASYTVPTQTNQTVGLYALGNTTQNSSTTLDARTISYNALGAMTMGYSNGSVQVSAPAVSSLSATGDISISTNGSTISIGMSKFGTLQAYEIKPFVGTATSNFIANTGSSGIASFYPFELHNYVAAGHINIVQSMSFITLGTSSGQQTFSQSWAIYTRGTGTNSTTLGTITSNSFSIGITGNNSTYTIKQPTTSNATGYGTGSTTSAGVNITSGYTGMKLVQLQINSTLSPGAYWLGLFNAASTSSINVGVSVSYFGHADNTQLQNLAPVGSFSSAFSGGVASGNNDALGAWWVGLGSFSSAAQTNLPNSVALSAISISSSNVATVYPYLRIVGTI